MHVVQHLREGANAQHKAVQRPLLPKDATIPAEKPSSASAITTDLTGARVCL